MRVLLLLIVLIGVSPPAWAAPLTFADFSGVELGLGTLSGTVNLFESTGAWSLNTFFRNSGGPFASGCELCANNSVQRFDVVIQAADLQTQANLRFNSLFTIPADAGPAFSPFAMTGAVYRDGTWSDVTGEGWSFLHFAGNDGLSQQEISDRGIQRAAGISYVFKASGLSQELGGGPITTAPEPATWVLLASGLLGLLAWRQRRTRWTPVAT